MEYDPWILCHDGRFYALLHHTLAPDKLLDFILSGRVGQHQPVEITEYFVARIIFLIIVVIAL